MLGDFFQCDPELRIIGTDLYLDSSEPRPIGIVSHGHADHIAAHEHFIATPATASFLRLRVNATSGTELPFEQPHRVGSHDITLFPAGHVLGSAMVLVSDAKRRLLYTGDFRLRESMTAERAIVPQCDAVITESTYGDPQWAFPSTAEIRERLVALAGDILRRGKVPVLLAYSLGKAQEACAMLAGSGHPVVLHSSVAKVTEIYAKHGVDLGSYEIWGNQQTLFGRATTRLAGKVVIVPPHMRDDIRRIRNRETVALTGWALRWPERQGTDHALPMSDHADFAELIELVERCGASTVYVTHGSNAFARELRRRGISAEFLRRRQQMRLF